MIIKVLKPRLPKTPLTPQCSVVIEETHNPPIPRDIRRKRVASYGMDVGCCARRSSHVIDGKHYCRLHAGQEALRRWEAGDLVTRDEMDDEIRDAIGDELRSMDERND